MTSPPLPFPPPPIRIHNLHSFLPINNKNVYLYICSLKVTTHFLPHPPPKKNKIKNKYLLMLLESVDTFEGVQVPTFDSLVMRPGNQFGRIGRIESNSFNGINMTSKSTYGMRFHCEPFLIEISIMVGNLGFNRFGFDHFSNFRDFFYFKIKEDFKILVNLKLKIKRKTILKNKIFEEFFFEKVNELSKIKERKHH